MANSNVPNQEEVPVPAEVPRLLANVSSPEHRTLLESLSLNRELDRLASFARWPFPHLDPTPADFAKYGFFYIGDWDLTRCFSCERICSIALSVSGEVHDPNCRLFLETDTCNAPVPNDTESGEQLAIRYPCQQPCHSNMESDEIRLATFSNRWPSNITSPTPAALANAGFFYTGEGDAVVCWYCGGLIKDWGCDAIPWEEHIRWFPTCEFLLRCHGTRLIHFYLSNFSHMSRPAIRRQSTNRVEREMCESTAVKLALNMGFQEEQIQQALMQTLHGGLAASDVDIFDPPESLIEALLEMPASLPTAGAESMPATSERRSTGNGTIPVESRFMDSYKSRLNSFDANWETITGVSPANLAAAGFYYIGEADRAKCYMCSGVLREWREDSDPWTEHAKWYPSCPHVVSNKGPDFIRSVTDRFPDLERPTRSASSTPLFQASQDDRLCSICCSEQKDALFDPCRHLYCCVSCADKMETCPVCRQDVERVLKVFMA